MTLPLTTYVGESYALVSVARAQAPVANDHRDWHEYVISQGTNRIVGHRPGSAVEARRAAEELVVQLNLRRVVKTRYGR